MIFDILFFLVGIVLNVIAVVLNFLLPFSLPSGYFASVSAVFATFNWLGGILDLPVFFAALKVFVGFELIWIFFLIIWYVVGFFRSVFSVGGANGH